MYKTNSLRLAALICLCACALISQTTQVQPADPIIHVSVNLVQIEAVVTGAKGVHIADLRPEDFQILEDGKEQKITHFSWVASNPKPAAPAPKAGAKAEVVFAPAKKLRREEVNRAVALILDDRHTSPVDIARLRPAIKKFADEQVLAGDLVSISAVTGGMGFYEQFTSDRLQLDKAVDALTHRVGELDSSFDTPSRGGCLRIELNFQLVMSHIVRTIGALSTLPGRKSIAFFTGAFSIPSRNCPDEAPRMQAFLKQVTNLANRSGVVFYTFDARGLETPGQFQAGSRSAIAGDPQIAGQEIADFFAGETGGIFAGSTNGLSEGLGKSLDDMNGYYTIGYQPARSAFELRRGQPVYHKIQVKVRRPGTSVRFSRGFLGSPESISSITPEAAALPTRESDLRDALFSPFDAGTLKVRLTPIYTAAPPNAAGKRGPALRVILSIDGAGLKPFDDAGSKKISLDIVTATYRADNKLVASKANEHLLTLTPAQFAQLASGITYQSDVPIPESGAYQIRVAVRDETSGAYGSGSAFVVIPDFNKDQLALAGVLLSDLANPDILGSAASRIFAPGGEIAFASALYGAKKDAAGQPHVESAVRLFLDGAPALDGGFAPVSATNAAEINVTGVLKLPGGLADGDYAVELVVRDTLANPKQQTASQWSELTVRAARN